VIITVVHSSNLLINEIKPDHSLTISDNKISCKIFIVMIPYS